MRWFAALLILAAVGLILRRLLHMDVEDGQKRKLLGSLSKDLHPLYFPISQEIETQATVLGITLNDAFGERESGSCEMAWHMVRLARGEWSRLAALVNGLQEAMTKCLPATDNVAIFRRIAVRKFKSRVARDRFPMYEFLDQVVFSSKHRFALQVRLLSRTGADVSKEFKRVSREGERSLDSSNEVWNRIDFLFHDFDLIAIETLLAFRTLLSSQTPEKAQELSAALQGLLAQKPRVAVSVQEQ